MQFYSERLSEETPLLPPTSSSSSSSNRLPAEQEVRRSSDNCRVTDTANASSYLLGYRLGATRQQQQQQQQASPLLHIYCESSSPARKQQFRYHHDSVDNKFDTTKSSSSPSSSSTRTPTEVRLSVDQVSLLYSPRAQETNAFAAPSVIVQHSDDLSILDPYFDVTTSRVQTVFEEANPNENGTITHEDFRHALETMGICCDDNVAFDKLVESIDPEATNMISFEQFDAAVIKLKLVHLFEDQTVLRLIAPDYKPARISVSDFSKTKLQQFVLKQVEIGSFFTSQRPSWVSVRWINLDGRDSLNLKRLAIKYRLHPLAIEDTLEKHERPKFDRYEGHVFLVFPVVRMELPWMHSNQIKVDPRTGKLRRSRSSHSMPSGLRHEDANARATSRTEDRDPFAHSTKSSSTSTKDHDPFKIWIEHVWIFIVGNKTIVTIKDGDLSHIWDELNRRLTIPYSKLRHNDAKFLLYAVLDVIVDQMTSVVDVITEQLLQLEDDLESQKENFDLSRLRFLKNELFRLPRLLKPARELLKYLIESKDFDELVTAYLCDVHDHIVQLLDDIELQLQMARLLTEEYRDAKANQMNYVIYTLTIVTTVFLPAQFLTGVYGMNFENMPELHTRYGYYFFWVFVLTIAVVLQWYFRHKKWI